MTPTQASITPSILLSTISSVPPSKCFSVRSSIHHFIHTPVHLSHPSIHLSTHPTPSHPIPSFLCPSLPSFIHFRPSVHPLFLAIFLWIQEAPTTSLSKQSNQFSISSPSTNFVFLSEYVNKYFLSILIAMYVN